MYVELILKAKLGDRYSTSALKTISIMTISYSMSLCTMNALKIQKG